MCGSAYTHSMFGQIATPCLEDMEDAKRNVRIGEDVGNGVPTVALAYKETLCTCKKKWIRVR
jgi:hypothetical protein